MYISERVKANLKVLEKAKQFPQVENYVIKESRITYENALREIEQYVVEINKPGEFSKRVIERLKKIANADDIKAANDKLLQQLDDATNDFYRSVTLDTSNNIVELRKDVDEGFAAVLMEMGKMSEGFAALQIMTTQKGNSVADEDIKKLNIKATLIEKDFDVEVRKNIKKRLYIGTAVAVKKLPNPDIEIEKVAKQARIISLLSACDHIEKFYGFYEKVKKDGKRYLFVVTAWMKNKSLREYLDENKSIDWKDKLTIATQIARGLEFCNVVDVYHRDVRSQNVLLNENLNAKLTNFEMSRKVGEISREMPLESLRWTAPEKLKYPKQPYTDKCEVYSFGILLWEISTHRQPFDDIENDMQACEKARKGGRPNPFSEDIPGEYKDIIEEAWVDNHMDRPTIHNVRKKLDKVMIYKKRRPPSRSDTLSSMISTNSIPDELGDGLLLGIDEVKSLHANKKYSEAFPYFSQWADRGDKEALYYAGLYLFKGIGIRKDEIKALQLLQKSAEKDYAPGQYMYAYACLKGTYYSKDEGITNLKKAAIRHKDPDALYMVSQFFLNGEHGYPVDNDKYMLYLKKAEAAGSEEAKKEREREEKKRREEEEDF